MNLWGSEPAGWSDDLRGWPRLRVIVNAMTRMRFCTLDGIMEFKAKGKLSNAPPGSPAVVRSTQPARCRFGPGHRTLVGTGPENYAEPAGARLGLFVGGHQCAVRLEDRQVFQVDCSPSEALPLKR